MVTKCEGNYRQDVMGRKGTWFTMYVLLCVRYSESVILIAFTIKLPFIVNLCENKYSKKY